LHPDAPYLAALVKWLEITINMNDQLKKTNEMKG